MVMASPMTMSASDAPVYSSRRPGADSGDGGEDGHRRHGKRDDDPAGPAPAAPCADQAAGRAAGGLGHEVEADADSNW